ncbi:MAG: hypothetical protein WKG06_06565 [Segetibacter sp.]
MEAQPHDSDVKAVLRLAVAWNILIANNRTTADFIVSSLLMQKTYKIQLEDYSKILKKFCLKLLFLFLLNLI